MLEKEIEESQRLVKTDAYQMSIGEIVSMYKDNELVIDPDFQRYFRWELGQKSKLIESILLGIPLPPIFVFEREDNKWELIDGLQRTSTLLEFMGLLKNHDGNYMAPSCLEATKYLPSLNNVVWEKNALITDVAIEEQIPIEKTLQLSIRRARIGVEILKRPSDNNTKYDLFQRLNSAGTPANPQELRNCIIIMINKEFFNLLDSFSLNNDFKNVINLTDDQIERQKHLEYVTRFLTYVYVPYRNKLDVEAFIDEGIKELATNPDTLDFTYRFTQTFEHLNAIFGNNSLKRLMTSGPQKGQHIGKIGLASFESIAIGIAKNIHEINGLENPKQFIKDKVESFWAENGIDQFFTPGLRGTIRIQRTLPFGETWFKP